MKRMVFSALAAAFVLCGLTITVDAHGRGGRGGQANCCPPPCAPVCAPAVQYVERQVTVYRPQMVEQEVTTKVCEMVPHQEKFVYNVCVPVVRQVKQKQTVYVPQQSWQEYNYTVMQPVTTQQKQRVVNYVQTQRNVETMVTVLQSSVVQRKVKQTVYQCVPQNVQVTVPVCRMVPVTMTDCCGCCYTTCRPVVENVVCNRVVMRSVAVQQDVVVNEVVCTPVQQKVTRVVCELVPQESFVMVNVCSYQPVPMKGKRLVCTMVAQVQDVVVNVCTQETRQEQGVRTVYTPSYRDVKTKVYTCQMVPTVVTQRVPVCTAAYVGAVGCGSWFSGCCH